jgi:PRC-barrel domain
MEAGKSDMIETDVEATAPALQGDSEIAPTETTVLHRDIAEWHGMELVDRYGERIGKLEEVYVDVETDEPQFGTVKEGLFGRHLTFVPLIAITIGPDNLQVPVSRQQVSDAPNIALRGDELDQADESALYHHYQLNYTPPDTPSGRRLARRS